MRPLPLPIIQPKTLKLFKEIAGDPLGEDELDRWVLHVLSTDKRLKQRSPHTVRENATAAERLNRRRHLRNLLQRYHRQLRRQARTPLKKHLLVWQRYRKNAVLDTLVPNRSDRWVLPARRRKLKDQGAQTINVASMSFFDDAEHSLEIITKMAEAELTGLNVTVNFNFDRCEDIGPMLLMAELVPKMAPVFTSGRMTSAVQKVLDSVGLRHALRMSFPGLTDHSDVYAFPVQRRRPTGSSSSPTKDLDPQGREKVADHFCDELDRWFDLSGTECELSGEGRSHLKNLIGELLCNAERHSSPLDKDGSWSVAGFMARRQDASGRDVFQCHLAFLSVGATIAESLKATAAPAMRSQIDSVVHKFRQVNGASQSADTLMTLAALQDTVTCDPKAFEESRGGTGFLDVIDFVRMLGYQKNGGCTAKIAIVSGNSCIKLEAPYIEGLRLDPTSGRRLWCNTHNSTNDPPDPSFVKDMARKLPGTVISVIFTLDQAFFREAYHAN